MENSNLSRERRVQTKLHAIFPIYKYISLSVDELGNTVRCSVPLTSDTSNHFGVVHAGVLFSLAEATAGLAITQHREFGKMLIVAQKVLVEYKRPARSAITATVSLDELFFKSLSAGLAADPKHRFEVSVNLHDEEGALVMQAVCGFQLRASMQS